VEKIAKLASTATTALARTHAHPVPIGMRSAPPLPGLYAIHAAAPVWRELGLETPPDERPLYVGKSDSSLAGRDVTTHFGFVAADRETSVTGYSTLRRSLARLLHDKRGFHGVPRNRSRPGNFANYGLMPKQDTDLSNWMRICLQLACWRKPGECSIAELELVERAVLGSLLPPLNLRGVVTPWNSKVDAARRMMAAEARAWGP
jgi:GIY-YIG catalytic domain